MAKCTISRTRMPEKDAEVLRSKFTFLEQNIEASHLTEFLFQQSIIDEDEMDSIDKIAVRKARNKELLQILLSRGNDAWSTFITALRTKGYAEVVNDLFLPKKGSVANSTKPTSRVSTRSENESGDKKSEVAIANYQKSYRESSEVAAESTTPNSDLLTLRHMDLKEGNTTNTLAIKVNKLETELKSVNDENESLKCELLLKDQTIAGNVGTIEKQTKEIGHLKDRQLQTGDEGKAKSIEALDNKVTVLQSDFNDVNTKLKRMEGQLEKLNSKVCVLS